MTNKKNQKYQIKSSEKYNDNFALDDFLELEAKSLEDDLNAIRTQIKQIIGKKHWYDNAQYPERLDLKYRFLNSDKTWGKILSDNSFFISPSKKRDVLEIYGGYGIFTQASNNEIIFSSNAKFYSNYKNAYNSISPSTQFDTLKIIGKSPYISTRASDKDDEKKIIINYIGPGSNNVWYNIFDSEDRSIYPSSINSVLEIVGENSIQCSASSKTVTISYPQDLSIGSSPSFLFLKKSSLSVGSIIYAGQNKGLVDSHSFLSWDKDNKRLGIGTDSPEKTVHVENGSVLHRRNDELKQLFNIGTNDSSVCCLKFYNGFLFYTDSKSYFNSIIVHDEDGSMSYGSNIFLSFVDEDTSEKGFEIRGKYAYICNSSILHVVDISDPLDMSEVGSVKFPSGDAQFPLIFGNKLFCFSFDKSVSYGGIIVHVVDIGNPFSPVIIFSDDNCLSSCGPSVQGVISESKMLLFYSYKKNTTEFCGRLCLFDLFGIDDDKNLSNKIIDYYDFSSVILSSSASGMYSSGKDIYIAQNFIDGVDSHGNIISCDIFKGIKINFIKNFSETNVNYNGLVRGGKNSFYLLRDSDIVTVENIDNEIYSRSICSLPGSSPCFLFGCESGGYIFVYSESESIGKITSFECSFENSSSLVINKTTLDYFSGSGIVDSKGSVISNSLTSVGDTGIVVNDSQGVNVSGDITSYGKVGIGEESPTEDFHISGGNLIHRINTKDFVLDALSADDNSMIFSFDTFLYIVSRNNSSISIWDLFSVEPPKCIKTISIPGATFPSNIIIIKDKIFYSKTDNVFGVICLGINNDFKTIELDAGAKINQIIYSGKYVYLSSNGYTGYSIYVIDISDLDNLKISGKWIFDGYYSPVDGINIDFMHKKDTTLFLYGFNPKYENKNLIISLDISDIKNIYSLGILNYSGSRVVCGYSKNDSEIFLGYDNKIVLKKYPFLEINSDIEMPFGENRQIHSIISLGATLYAGMSDGIDLWDIKSSPFFMERISVLGGVESKNSLESVLNFLFVFSGSLIHYLDLRTFNGTNSIFGSLNADFLSVTGFLKSNEIDSNSVLCDRFFDESNEGIDSNSSLFVKGRLSIGVDEILPEYKINISGGGIRHKSGKFFDKVDAIFSCFDENIVSFQYYDRVVYVLRKNNSEKNIKNSLCSIAIDDEKSPYLLSEYFLEDNLDISVVGFCFNREYCYILYKDGRLSVIDVSDPSFCKTISYRTFVDIDSEEDSIGCEFLNNSVYVIASNGMGDSSGKNDIYRINVINASQLFLSGKCSIDFIPESISKSNNEIVVYIGEGACFFYSVSKNSIFHRESESFAFETMLPIKCYGDVVFGIKYNVSKANCEIFIRNRFNDNSYRILDVANGDSLPVCFEIIENGFIVVLENKKCLFLRMNDYGFSGGNIFCSDIIDLPPGSFRGFISLGEGKVYYSDINNSKLLSYKIGGLNVSSVKTDFVSLFDGYCQSMLCSGGLITDSIIIGSGGLNVFSEDGIVIGGNIFSIKGAEFGGRTKGNSKLFVLNGNVSQTKKNDKNNSILSINSDGNIIDIFCDNEKLFVLKSNDIYAYKILSYGNYFYCGKISLETSSDFYSVFIDGNYLYHTSGGETNSVVTILNISDLENIEKIFAEGHIYDNNFYNVSSIVSFGNYAFIVTGVTGDHSILILDISDKKNIKIIKKIQNSLIGGDIQNLSCNGKFLIALVESTVLWFDIRNIFNTDILVYSSNILSDFIKFKIYDGLLFVLSSNSSDSKITIYSMSGEVKYIEDDPDCLNVGALIAQISLDPNALDFVIEPETLIVSYDSKILYYQIMKNYSIYKTGETIIPSVKRMFLYRDYICTFDGDNITIILSGELNTPSVTSISSNIGDIVVFEKFNVSNSLYSSCGISIGEYGINSIGNIVSNSDGYFLNGISVGGVSCDNNAYFENKMIQIDGSSSMLFSSKIVSSDDFFIPSIGDMIQEESVDPSIINSDMRNVESCAFFGDYIFVVSRNSDDSDIGSLCAIDISNPKSPIYSGGIHDIELESNQLIGKICLKIQGSFAYITTSNSVSIYDISQVNNIRQKLNFSHQLFSEKDFPFESSNFDIFGIINDVIVSGDRMYVASSGAHFITVFDISDSDNIRIIASNNFESLNGENSVSAYSLFLKNDILYVSLNGIDNLYGYAFDVSFYGFEFALNPIQNLSTSEQNTSVISMSCSNGYFYSIDNETKKIYVQDIVLGNPVDFSFIYSDDFSDSECRIKSFGNFLYVMTKNDFFIYKNVNGELLLQSRYGDFQSNNFIHQYSDFEIIGRLAYILNKGAFCVEVVDIFGFVADFINLEFLNVGDLKIQHNLSGSGEIRSNGDTIVGNSVLSSGSVSSSMIKTNFISKGGKIFKNNEVFLSDGSLSVGDSDNCIQDNRFFLMSFLNNKSINKSVFRNRIGYFALDDGMYAVDFSSETPDFLGEIQTNSSSFNIINFVILNDFLYVVEAKTENYMNVYFSCYSFPDRFSDDIGDALYECPISGEDVPRNCYSIFLYQEYVVCLWKEGVPMSGKLNCLIYNTFDKKIIFRYFIPFLTPGVGSIISEVYKGVAVVKVDDSSIYCFNLDELIRFKNFNLKRILYINKSLKGFFIKDDFLYVSFSIENSIILYNIVKKDLLLDIFLMYNNSFFVPCSSPNKMLCVGSTMFVSFNPDSESIFENQIGVYNINENGGFEYLYSVEQIGEEKMRPFSVSLCGSYVVFETKNSDNNKKCFFFKPSVAKTVGAKFLMLESGNVESTGGIIVSGNSSVGSLNSFGDIFTRGQFCSLNGFSGQAYGYRMTIKSLSLLSTYTFRFQNQESFSIYETKFSGEKSGVIWKNDPIFGFQISNSGKYEMSFSGSFLFDESSDVLVSFNSDEKIFSFSLDANKNKNIFCSYIFSVDLDGSNQQKNLGISISSAKAYNLGKYSTFLLRKIS